MLSAGLSKSVSSKGSKKKLNEQDSKSLRNRKSENGKKSWNDNANLNKQPLSKPRRSVCKQQRPSDSASKLKLMQLYKLRRHDWRRKRPPRSRKQKRKGLNLRKQQLQLRHSRLQKLPNSKPNWRQRPKPRH